MHRFLLVAAAASAAAATGDSSSPLPVAAATAPENRAVVVIDTGQEVRRVCVRFAEDFLTGQELLIRANADPVFKHYSGLGAAVCALCGVGCPADESCLTCGGDDHWAYSRAPKGSSTFRLSGAGASNTKVYDGDVEGWRWSTGLLPAYASVDQVCGPAPGATTTSSAPVTSPTSAAAAATTSTTARRATTSTTTREASRVAGEAVETATSLVAAPTTTASVPPTSITEHEVAAPPTVPTGDDGSGGSAASLLAFAAALAGLLGWAVWLRRPRRRNRIVP